MIQYCIVNKLSPRIRSLIFAGVSVLAMFLLAASLSSLTFDPGSPVSFARLAPDVVDEGIEAGWLRNLAAAFRILIILAWIFLPVFIIYLIIDKNARRRFLRDLLMLLPFILLMYVLSENRNLMGGEFEGMGNFVGTPGLEGLQTTPAPPPPEFVPPPAWVTTFTSLLLAVTIALVFGAIIFSVFRRAQKQQRLAPIVLMEQEAQAAIDALESGGDLREVIQRCYLQMVNALREYRNIHRSEDVTPREFEDYLQRQGLPYAPVHQLTELFEQVRYGARRPSPAEERAAINSLSAIVAACKRTRVK